MRAWLARALAGRTGLFLLSLAIAVAMWSYVRTAVNPPPERALVASLLVRNVEVTFNGLPNGWRASSDPRTVDIEMRGPASAVLAVRPTDVRAIAEVGALDADSYRVALRIPVPAGVTTAQASPPSVVVTLLRP
jgi:hypothetical protein